MNRHCTAFGQSNPVCLRSRSVSEPVVLVSGDVLVAASAMLSPLVVVRVAPFFMTAKTSSAKPRATLASSELLYFATAPYHLPASVGVAPTVSRAYAASSAAPARMFCPALVLISEGETPVAADAAAMPRTPEPPDGVSPLPPAPFSSDTGALDASSSCIGPYPPAALGCMSVSQRLTTYDTASRTFWGTRNSLAADANADWSEDVGVADAGEACARMRIAATTYATRCVMPVPPYRSGRDSSDWVRHVTRKRSEAGW